MSTPLDVAADAPVPTASSLLGGTLICFCIMFMLYGVTTCQAYVYMLNSRDDPRWIKIMVATTWVLETVHSAFCIRMLYFLVILGFGSIENASRIDWSLGPIVILENVIVGIVEGFFLRRMWILSKHSYTLVFGTVFLLLVRVGCHTTALVLGLQQGTWDKFRSGEASNITVEVSNSLSAAVDSIIAISMIYYLHRGQGDIEKTNSIVRWLMGYTVNSGAIMMIVSLAIVITYAKVQESLIFLGLVTMVSKVYANCLYGTLNARRMLRNMPSSREQYSSRSRGGAIELSKLQVTSGQTRPRIEIYQEKTQITDASPYDSQSQQELGMEKPGFVAM
ncbi:hypothetical protein K474DRAFT_1656530 [Panus rudis PR-1116 ss-1]|nr:hypothetical protein K474DRAFT_1656530 [Panus rudis PR-1116 ss-1]